MDTEKYKKAWQEFQEKMSTLRKKQAEILNRINENLDKQKIDKIRKKINQ